MLAQYCKTPNDGICAMKRMIFEKAKSLVKICWCSSECWIAESSAISAATEMFLRGCPTIGTDERGEAS